MIAVITKKTVAIEDEEEDEEEERRRRYQKKKKKKKKKEEEEEEEEEIQHFMLKLFFSSCLALENDSKKYPMNLLSNINSSAASFPTLVFRIRKE